MTQLISVQPIVGKAIFGVAWLFSGVLPERLPQLRAALACTQKIRLF